jgi:hypothetical protein
MTSRQPAGTSTGGQFAPDTRPRAAVRLDAGDARVPRSRASIQREIDEMPMKQRREIALHAAPLAAERLDVDRLQQMYDGLAARNPRKGSREEAQMYAVEVTLAETAERNDPASPAPASSANVDADPAASATEAPTRDTPGLADSHRVARDRAAAERNRAERIAAQLLAERATAHHPDAATVHLALGDQDMRRFLYVESVRDSAGNEIRISDELADELNDFAGDLDPVHSGVTVYDDESLDVLDVRNNHLREGDI